MAADDVDYYTLLGIERAAKRDEVRAAFHRFALEHHPDRHTDLDAEGALEAAARYRRGAEAYRVLSDAEARRAYDQGLEKGQNRLDPESAGKPAPKPAAQRPVSPKAKPFWTKAEQALKANDFKTARLNLKIALQSDPGHPMLEQKLAEVEAKLPPKKD